MKMPLRSAWFSDVHLGHPKTETSFIIDNLVAAFPDDGVTEQLDILFFPGDVFDRILFWPDQNVLLIREWIIRTLSICARRNIIVRVLYGTPSHDRNQGKVFEEINKELSIGADVRYVDTLSIEHIEALDMNVLYVPDEWDVEPDNTWSQVCSLMKAHGLEKVDFSVMHGCFPFQLPDFLDIPMHDPQRYMSITEHYVVIGHIHKHASFENILVPGSFDRLGHGEPEDKGHLRITVNRDAMNEIKFVVNENSKVYTDVDCSGMELEKAIDKVKKVANKLPVDSHIRVIANPGEPIISDVTTLMKEYPLLNWTAKRGKDAKKINSLQTTGTVKFKGVDITRENLAEMLLGRIKPDPGFPDLHDRCLRRIQEVI